MKLQPFTIAAIVTVLWSFPILTSATFDLTRKNNIVLYWGQNAIYNLDQENRTDRYQKRLVEYCKSTNVDALLIAFLYKFNSTGGYPEVNFANSCWGPEFPESKLMYCSQISADIKTCQKTYGKKILISLGGGASNSYGGWPTVAEAQAFAQMIWNMFGNTWYYYRPFGDAIVDGFDLDLEYGPNTNYEQFAYQLRKLMDADKKATGKSWYLTAAPQCMNPDTILNTTLTKVSFDAIHVQFYNNPSCSVNKWVKGKDVKNNTGFNFAGWDNWAKTKSFNKNIKVFLGMPMHPAAAGSGYVSSSTAASVIADISRFTSFSGVAAWDASFAWANSNYLPTVRTALNKAQSAFSSVKVRGFASRLFS